jgi:DNA-binding transcriptional LysR family regulator
MKLHQLNALLAIADKGSFTGAAAALAVSQSSLSHAMAEFERELGVSVLARDRQGARLTEVGARVSDHARQVLAAVDSIRAEAQGAKGILTGRIRLGSIPSAAVSFVPRIIARFSRQHAGVEIVLLEEPSQSMRQLAEWLRDGTIDIALLELPMAGLRTVPVLKDQFCAIVSAGSALAARDKASARDLAGEPFIMSRYASERVVGAIYARHKVSLRVRFEVQDLSTLVSLVREGLGISIVPRVAFPETPPGVALLPLLPAVPRELGFALKSWEHQSPALAAFVRSFHRSRASRHGP